MKVRSPDGDREYFNIVAGVLQGDTLAPYLFIICLDYVLRTSIDKIRENGFELTKKRSKRYPDADYADDLALLTNTPNQAETLLHSFERAAAGIGLHINAHKTEDMCYNQTGNITTLDGASLKLVDKFTFLGSSVSSTENNINTRLTKAWTAIDRLSIIWKSDLTDKMKRSFFQAAVVSILLYGCTTWTLNKRLEKKLYSNYTRMLRAIFYKSWRQHPTRHQLYGHLPPITKTIQARRTRHAGHCWRSKDEFISDVLLWTPTYGQAKAGGPARTYIEQLCEDTGCNPEDLPGAMNDREKWREMVRDIRASGTIWWWWYIHICMSMCMCTWVCAYMCVYEYIYIYIYICVCLYAYVYVSVNLLRCGTRPYEWGTRTYSCRLASRACSPLHPLRGAFMCVFVYINFFVYVYMYIHVCPCACVHASLHIYERIYIYAYACECACSVDCGCRIHQLHLCREVRPLPPTSVLIMTLNNLMASFQRCLSFGEWEAPTYCHRFQVHSGREW